MAQKLPMFGKFNHKKSQSEKLDDTILDIGWPEASLLLDYYKQYEIFISDDLWWLNLY